MPINWHFRYNRQIHQKMQLIKTDTKWKILRAYVYVYIFNWNHLNHPTGDTQHPFGFTGEFYQHLGKKYQCYTNSYRK